MPLGFTQEDFLVKINMHQRGFSYLCLASLFRMVGVQLKIQGINDLTNAMDDVLKVC